MRPGERQVAETLDGIRSDHVERYRFAIGVLVPDLTKTVLDIACGVGYGAQLMVQRGLKVTAIDCDELAIQYAKKHYKGPEYLLDDAKALSWASQVDAVVCFETIEHIEDPAPMLKLLASKAKRLIASVPNESVFPYEDRILYHHRHYTAEQFESLLNECGWQVDSWHGQLGQESPVEPLVQGRTLVAVAHPENEPVGGTWEKIPVATAQVVPESVAIVAMGASSRTYLQLASNKGDRRRVADEIWAINAMGGVIAHDLLFHMDDVKIQESRAEVDTEGNIAGMLSWLKEHPRFMTSRVYPDYPGAIEFPLEDVVNSTGLAYLNSTVAYAVAYATYLGVKKISLYGCDYSYENSHQAERGRGCVEFLLGIAAARGINIQVASDSTLLDANVPDDQKLYGYDTEDVTFTATGERIKVTRSPCKEIPSAAEMEKRYCHELKQ